MSIDSDQYLVLVLVLGVDVNIRSFEQCHKPALAFSRDWPSQFVAQVGSPGGEGHLFGRELSTCS